MSRISRTAPDTIEEVLSRQLDRGEGDIAYFAAIFRDLLATPGISPADAAQRIRHDFLNGYLATEPEWNGLSSRFAVGSFLQGGYEVIFELARVVPHEDVRQDLLVQTLLELRKLPPQPSTREGEEDAPYVDDLVFAVVSEDSWNQGCPREQGSDPFEEYNKKCKRWVNVSSFLARCSGAGLYEKHPDCLKHPSVDVVLGLEPKRLDPPLLRKTRALVAALWILHAGQTIFDDMVKHDKPSWGPSKWKTWGEKLVEVASDINLGEEVRSVAIRALGKMVAVSVSSRLQA
ncbi:hypothetical protein QBC34DRAFT_411220 [Podospora aff. communis PSN243]|uniref:Uncharacterized protein n=1 Tax=Podospora aff. communis PSN243 TaxID=3040156 RepID=A0AAV9GER5_9PEZI|nr:hypothetical protein QBC34DRAFT_411220 [Podospora aff. communis PSN243]